MIYVTTLKGDNLARGTRYDLCYNIEGGQSSPRDTRPYYTVNTCVVYQVARMISSGLYIINFSWWPIPQILLLLI